MTAMLRPLAGLAALAGIGAELAGHRGFTRLVQQDVQALPRGRAGVVTEEISRTCPSQFATTCVTSVWLAGGFPARSGSARRAGCGPAQASGGCPLDAGEHYSVHPPGFVWVGTPRLGPLPVGRARDMCARGPRVDAGQGGLAVAGGRRQRRADRPGRDDALPERDDLVPAAFLADNVSFEPVDDSSARVTLTDHGRTATATLFFDKDGLLTDFVAKRYRTADASSPETRSTPITGYGEFEGLRLPVRGGAAWKLPSGDLEYSK